MQCFYIGIFERKGVKWCCIIQLDLNKLTSFGEKEDKCLKTVLNFQILEILLHVLFIGNNMITGQNGCSFFQRNGFCLYFKIMNDCANELKDYFGKQGKKIHIVSFKDFYENVLKN